MSNRVTSQNFINNNHYQLYIEQLVELKGHTVTSRYSDEVYEVNAILGKPINDELVQAVWGLMQFTDDPEDFEATFDKDGFDISYRLDPHDPDTQAYRLKNNVEPIVQKAVQEFLTDAQNI